MAVVAASLLAVFFVVCAIRGGVDSYSPIPFWDMWIGYLGFFTGLSDDPWTGWWRPHNEHRIVFSKLLFWLDLHFFRGSIVFLVVANFVLAALAAWLFAAMARQASPAEAHSGPARIIGAAVVCLLFSWTQSDNFGWGFQSAFFLAQLVPLFAFYLLYRAQVAPTRRQLLFASAALVGFASLGTMANGVLVLPLMAVLAGVLRMGKPRVAILVVLAVVALLLYFSGTFPARQRMGLGPLVANPLALLHYAVLYLGSPFYYLPGVGRLAADVAGVFFLVGTACLLVRVLPSARAPVGAASVVPLTLLFFIAYIMATAFITGYGRLAIGLEQATSSRYTTTALMGWCALLVAAASLARRDTTRWWVGASTVLVALLLVPRQLIAFDTNPYPFERLVAGLALEMGVRDERQIREVTPRLELTLAVVEKARARELSAFGRRPLQGIRERIGQQHVTLPAAPCRAYIESVAAVPEDERYRSIEGWIYQPDARVAPAEVLLVDATGRLVGYGLTGKWRPDVAQVLGIRARATGFKGYLLSSYTGERIFVVGEEPACQWEGDLPPLAGGAGG
jgi:hypothetical protein